MRPLVRASYPRCPKRCRCPINRPIGTTCDLMQRAELETPSRKHPVDLSYAEWKDLAPARRAAFEARDAPPEFGQNEGVRGRGHVRRSRLQLWYVLSLFSLTEESMNKVVAPRRPKIVANFGHDLAGGGEASNSARAEHRGAHGERRQSDPDHDQSEERSVAQKAVQRAADPLMSA